MRIEKVAEKDLPEINGLVEKEFPYVERSSEKLKEKMREGRIVIFKAVKAKRILGFIEVEFFEQEIARINGLSVKEDARDKGVGKTLLQSAVEFLKEKDVKRIVLLVKQSNRKAKELYEKNGFKFIGLYHREIDNAVVEEMELDLAGETPGYVS
jgi:ribosomal protein S18 acetylase RimI-like enzyme